MILGGKTQLRARATLPVAIAFLALVMGCSDDKTTGGTGGTGGSGGAGTGGSGGAGTGGSGTAGSGTTGGSGGEAGTGGSAGAAGTAGSGGTAGGGGAATGGAAGSAGSAGSGGAGKAGAAGSAGSAGSSGTGGGDGGTPDPRMNFFVTSDTSKTGNLSGLMGADARCTRLATAVGQGSKTWRAYLSTEAMDGGPAVNAKDRIGAGPYYNSKGAMLASNSAALHARSGDAELFIDENGQKIKGQWAGSGTPVEHDVLTGSMGDGTVLAGQTCVNWTSEAMTNTAQVGHADGLGPSMSDAGTYPSWNSSHANGGCNDTAPKGGAGRVYCFVSP